MLYELANVLLICIAVLLVLIAVCLARMWVNNRTISRDIAQARVTLSQIEAKHYPPFLAHVSCAPLASSVSNAEMDDEIFNSLRLASGPINAAFVQNLTRERGVKATYDDVVSALTRMAKEQPPRVVQDPPRFWRINKTSPATV